MKRSLLIMAAVATTLVPAAASAADHLDGSAVQASPEADVNDLYAWVDSSTLKLIMTVSPFADATSSFSDEVQYVFHIGSAPMPLAAPTVKVDVLCQFDVAENIQCWVSDGEAAVADYVTGDASNSDGIKSMSGDTRVFAGLVDDPFFFYLKGFTDTRDTVLTFVADTLNMADVNAAGCPDLSKYPGTSAALVGLLNGNGTATNTFAMAKTLAISIELNKALVTKGGQNVSVWASTNQRTN